MALEVQSKAKVNRSHSVKLKHMTDTKLAEQDLLIKKAQLNEIINKISNKQEKIDNIQDAKKDLSKKLKKIQKQFDLKRFQDEDDGEQEEEADAQEEEADADADVDGEAEGAEQGEEECEEDEEGECMDSLEQLLTDDYHIQSCSQTVKITNCNYINDPYNFARQSRETFVFNVNGISMFATDDPSSLIEHLYFSEIISIKPIVGAPDCFLVENTVKKVFQPCLGNLENVNGFLDTFRVFEKCRQGIDPNKVVECDDEEEQQELKPSLIDPELPKYLQHMFEVHIHMNQIGEGFQGEILPDGKEMSKNFGMWMLGHDGSGLWGDEVTLDQDRMRKMRATIKQLRQALKQKSEPVVIPVAKNKKFQKVEQPKAFDDFNNL